MDRPTLVTARDAAQFAAGALMFREYAAAIAVDLCFQGFEDELARIDEVYGAQRRGLLLLAETARGEHAACGALRELDGERCEMKRLYVRPAWRGHGLGRRIAEALVATARQLAYREMLLDTLQAMEPARALYRSLGFAATTPYYHNPLEGVVYLRLAL